MRRSVLGIAAALSAMLIGACGTSSDHLNKPNPTVLTHAAYATSRERGYVYTMRFTAAVGGRSAAATGTGTIDSTGREGTFTEQSDGQTVTLLVKWPYIYAPGSTAEAVWQLSNTGAKPWVRADYATYSESSSGALGTGGTNPILTINFLKATGRLMTVGTQSVNGVATTHYHALVDSNRIAATVPPSRRPAAQQTAQTLKHLTGTTTFPIDVWVDSQQHVRRIAVHLQTCVPGYKFDESVTFTILRYANPPPVQVPPRAQFTDVTERLKTRASQTRRLLDQIPGC